MFFTRKAKKVYHYHPGTYIFPIPFIILPINTIGLCKVEMIVNDAFDTTVIITQDDKGKGSITNNSERIANSIQKLFFQRLGVQPECVKWIELYPAGVVMGRESRCSVVMQWDAKKGVYHSPEWRTIQDHEVVISVTDEH